MNNENWQIYASDMIVLRPLNVWRNITKLNQRFNGRTQSMAASLALPSRARIMCTAPNSQIFRKPIITFHVPHICLATSSIVRHQNHLEASSTQKRSLWLQWRQNVDPYARLMRIDRPIGMKLFCDKFFPMKSTKSIHFHRFVVAVLAMRMEHSIECGSGNVARPNRIDSFWCRCIHYAWSWMHNQRHVGQRYRCQSRTNEKSTFGQRTNKPIGRSGISVGSVECRINGSSAIELAVDSIGCQFTWSGHHLSIDETHHVLATIRARHDIQLGRTARLVCDARIGRLGRVLTTLHGRCVLDYCIRYHLCSSGNSIDYIQMF